MSVPLRVVGVAMLLALAVSSCGRLAIPGEVYASAAPTAPDASPSPSPTPPEVPMPL